MSANSTERARSAQREPLSLAAPSARSPRRKVACCVGVPWSAGVRRFADEWTWERPRVPLLRSLATGDLPVVIDPGHLILVAQRQHETVDWAIRSLHVVADHPGLDKAGVPIDLHVLIALEVHGGVVHEHAVFDAFEVVVERPFLQCADHDTVRM